MHLRHNPAILSMYSRKMKACLQKTHVQKFIAALFITAKNPKVISGYTAELWYTRRLEYCCTMQMKQGNRPNHVEKTQTRHAERSQTQNLHAMIPFYGILECEQPRPGTYLLKPPAGLGCLQNKFALLLLGLGALRSPSLIFFSSFVLEFSTILGLGQGGICPLFSRIFLTLCPRKNFISTSECHSDHLNLSKCCQSFKG